MTDERCKLKPQRTPPAQRLLTVLTLLEELGVTLELDWDNALMTTVPGSLSAGPVRSLIERHSQQITQSVLSRAALRKWRFVGGPLDRKPHCRSPWFQKRIVWREARAKWAVYQLEKDGRAFFKGYAASEQKGRHGRLKVTEAELRAKAKA